MFIPYQQSILKELIQKLKKTLRTRRQTLKMKRFYSQFIDQGDLIYDAGANRGRYTQVFLKLGASVIAIEPHPSCLAELNKIKSSSLTIVPNALSNTAGTATFMLCNEDEVSTLSTEFVSEYDRQDFLNWDDKIVVETTTFDHIISLHGLPRLLKIDIEGFEHIALKSLSHPIDYLSFEFTYPFRHYAIDCIDLIANLGDYQFNYYPYERFTFELDSWKSASEMRQVLDTIDPSILVGDIYAKRIT